MPQKRNWFGELVDGFFDLISTGKPKVDAIVKGVATAALLLVVASTSVTYLATTAVDGVVALDNVVTGVMDNSEESLDAIDASVTGAVAAVGSTVNEVAESASVIIDDAADATDTLIEAASEMISPSEVAVSDATISVSEVPTPDS